ncbi:hypothetical protein MTO96_018599 [Rhipicephalus appendiculatus]
MADSTSNRNYDEVVVHAPSRRDFDDENATSVTEDNARRRGKRPRSPSRCVPQSPHRKLQLVPTPGLRVFVPGLDTRDIPAAATECVHLRRLPVDSREVGAATLRTHLVRTLPSRRLFLPNEATCTPGSRDWRRSPLWLVSRRRRPVLPASMSSRWTSPVRLCVQGDRDLP